jgi:ADP-heptose:LPS heptosyltransferase
MHVAASLGKPMVSVFGPTNPVHIGPTSDRNRSCAWIYRVRHAITGA